MKKLFTSIVISFLTLGALFAGEINQSQALDIALKFYNQKAFKSGIQKIKANNLELNYIKKYKSVSSDSLASFYVFNKGNSGFIIVSGSDKAKQILGYSDESSFDINNCPDNFRYWLDFYNSQISSINDTTEAFSESFSVPIKIKEENIDSFSTSVSPLLGGIKWDQGSPYNNLCPSINSSGDKAVTGCVATAMAQVMRYHKWPISGTGSKSYTTNTLGIPLSLDFSQTTFDWDNMTETYSSSSTDIEKEAVATLMYNCGVAVEMDYNTSSGAGSMALAHALIEYFGYNDRLQQYSRDYYTREEWIKLLKTELNAGRPVPYGGGTQTSGHQFVLDGYDSDGLFHINWGWSGSSNGYFEITALNPSYQGIGGSDGGFDYSQNATVGIQKTTQTSDKTYLLYEDASPTTSTSVTSKFAKFQVSAKNVFNKGVNTFSGAIAIGIYKNDTLKEVTAQQAVSDLDFGWGWTNLTYTVSLKSSLTDGDYKIYLVYKENSETEWQIMRTKVGTANYINLNLNGITATLDVPSTIESVLSVDSIAVIGNLYSNEVGRIAIKVTNSGEEYNSLLGVKLTSKTDSSVYQIITTESPANITKNETRTFTLRDTITLDPQECYINVMYDPGNNYNDLTDFYTIGDSITKEILEAPTEDPNLTLTKSIYFENNRAVNKNNATLYAYLKNTSGVFNSEVIAFIFNTSGGSSLTSIGYQEAFFDTNETQALTFIGPINLNTGNYLAKLYYYNGATWNQVTPSKYSSIIFTLVDDETSTNDIVDNKISVFPNPVTDILNVTSKQNIKDIKITDLTGKTIINNALSGTKAQLLVSDLPEGIYFLTMKTTEGNYTEKFIKK